MASKIRRAGSKWRLLVHEMLPRGWSGTSYNVAHDNRFGGGDGQDSELSKHIELPNTDFDELVVGSWLHIEQMDTGKWWMNIGNVTLWVEADREGRPKHVRVYGPLDYDGEFREGVTYECTWTDEVDHG